MEIEFDPDKSEANTAQRGLPFGVAALILANVVAEFEDTRHAYGERRMVAFGLVKGRLLCCVYVQRGAAIRVISLRKANKKEIARWLP